jgi:hypothetical protein
MCYTLSYEMAKHIIREIVHKKNLAWHTTWMNKCQSTQQANLQVMDLETTEQSSLLKLWTL